MRNGSFSVFDRTLVAVAIILGYAGCGVLHDRDVSPPEYLAAKIKDDHSPGSLRLFPLGAPKWISPRYVAMQGNTLFVITRDGQLLETANFTDWRKVDKSGLPPSVYSIAATEQHVYATASAPQQPSSVYERTASGTWQIVPGMNDRGCQVLADVADAFAICERNIWRFKSKVGKWTKLAVMPFVRQIFSILLSSESIAISEERDSWISYSRIDGRSQQEPGGPMKNFHGTEFFGAFPPIDVYPKGVPPELQTKVTLQVERNGIEIIGTREGLYIRRSPESSFSAINGEFNPLETVKLIAAGRSLFARTNSNIFESQDDGQSWQRLDVSLAFLPPGNIVERDGELVYETTRQDQEPAAMGGPGGTIHSAFYRRRPGQSQWEPFDALTPPQFVTSICVVGDALFALGHDKLFISDRPGSPMHEAVSFQDVTIEGQMACADDSVFVSVGPDLYRHRLSGGWEKLRNNLDGGYVRTLHSFGKKLYAMNESQDIFELTAPDLAIWRKFGLQGIKRGSLGQSISGFWVDPRHPEVVVLATDAGMAWSTDRGQSFTIDKGSTASIPGIASLVSQNGYLWVGGQTGVSFVQDRIERHSTISDLLQIIVKNRKETIPMALLALLFIFGSTRLILLCLQWDIVLIRDFARWFYLTRYGHWRLYRKYRGTILSLPEMRFINSHFVDLPCEWKDDAADSRSLEERLVSKEEKRNVELVAPGGSGKSTVCSHLLMIALRGSLIFGKRREAVLVEGYTYGGSLLDSLVAVLRRNGCYVNRNIVESQCLLGRYLIILDGYSEIPASAAAPDSDLSTTLSSYPECVFVFSSRTELPAVTLTAANPIFRASLSQLTKSDEARILKRYLRDGVDPNVIGREIEGRYPDLPRLPLLLRLVAHSYTQHGSVPQNDAELFRDYLRDLLSPEKINLKDASGVHYAVETLVRRMHIDRLGQRGFLADDAIAAFADIYEQLQKRYGLNISAYGLVQLLIQSGLLRTDGISCRFFHDSFESYYAGLVLAKELLRGNKELIKHVGQEPRLNEALSFLRKLIPPEQQSLVDAAIAG